jgi:predicted branched-subunit amino acid permease
MNTFRLYAHEIFLGFKTVLPLWLAAAPFAIAYTISARQIGLAPFEIQLMSLTMYSAAAQMATVQLLSAGASTITFVLMVVTLNIHHLLYGLSLAQSIKLSPLKRIAAASLLTDAAYAVTIQRKANFSFLLGAELSMFAAWNIFTAFGLLMGQVIGTVSSVQLDFVVPLSFFVVLVSSVKSRTDLAVALFATVATVMCLVVQLGSATIIVVGLASALLGAAFSERHKLLVKRSLS